MGDRPAARRAPRIAALVVAVVALLAGLVAGQHLLARPDCGGFDPVAMGRIEAGMWRNYYSHRWGRLGLDLLGAACGQYGFSWWDGIRVATHTSRAAALFRMNADDPRCQPELERYYRIVAPALRGRFDPAEAARLELAWWRERRRDVPPHAYADTIARLTALLHGIPREEALPACLLRAEAMAYRDARDGGRMTEADWAEVTRILTAAHASLRARLDARGTLAE